VHEGGAGGDEDDVGCRERIELLNTEQPDGTGTLRITSLSISLILAPARAASGAITRRCSRTGETRALTSSGIT
jgi:hypothetical protein